MQLMPSKSKVVVVSLVHVCHSWLFAIIESFERFAFIGLNLVRSISKINWHNRLVLPLPL